MNQWKCISLTGEYIDVNGTTTKTTALRVWIGLTFKEYCKQNSHTATKRNIIHPFNFL